MEVTAWGKMRMIVFYNRQKGERTMLRVVSMFFGWCQRALQNHVSVLIKNLKYVGVGERGR